MTKAAPGSLYFSLQPLKPDRLLAVSSSDDQGGVESAGGRGFIGAALEIRVCGKRWSE